MEEGAQVEACGTMPASNLRLEGQWKSAFVIRRGPEGMLAIPAVYSVCSEDSDGASTSLPLSEGDRGNTFAAKEDLNNVPAVSTREGFYHEDAHCSSSSQKHLEQDETTSVMVKKEPEESVAILPEDDGSCSGTFDSEPSLQAHPEDRLEDYPLRVIEEPANSSLSLPQVWTDQARRKIFRSGRTWHRCLFCPYSNIAKCKVLTHERSHTERLPFSCDICQSLFRTRVGLLNHLRTHVDQGPFKCSTRPKELLGRDIPLAHERMHKDVTETNSGGTVRNSKGSGTGTASQEDKSVTEQCKTHQRPAKYQCQFCPYFSHRKKRFITHERTHTEEKTFSCHFCDKTFTDACDLQSHEWTHTVVKPFSCSFCPETFALRTNLQVHEKTHAREKPVHCYLCRKVFADVSHLRRHERTHIGEKLFSCRFCPKTCTLRSSLQRHEKAHIARELLNCRYCHKAFVSISSLQAHERTHTGEKPYSCRFCHKAFVLNHKLKAHERTHTGERPNVCKTCGRAFALKYGLRKHQRRMHNM